MRLYYIILLSTLCFFSFTAKSEVYNCERIRLDSQGFQSKSAASSWFNDNITITTDLDKKTAKYKGSSSDLKIRDDKKRINMSFERKMRGGQRILVRFTFLANGEVHAELKPVGGYKVPGGAVYKCIGWSGSL